ncbi:MAG TPA: calcium/proton exchanger [Lacunisphaera sp.]|jgi:Ca2+:H+ antiporter
MTAPASASHRSWLSLNWLLVFMPVAIALRYVPSWKNETALFVVSALAIVPLAGRMGEATEQLAHRLGAGVGGLLNASFGNAAELIIALMALKAGLIDVVKASITGSIIGNLLLVLGVSIFCGGLRHSRQQFNKTAVRASCTALMLAAFALVIPTVFHVAAERDAGKWSPVAEQDLSVAIAIVLLLSYVALLIFSLVTHSDLFSGEQDKPSGEKEEHVWPVSRAVITLLIATGAVAWVSEFLVGAVEAARSSFGITETFVGVIVIAIIGNAAEHSTAVAMALKNKMDLAIGIAVGSSLQIALFVTPVLVLVSLFFRQHLSLEFSLPEVIAVVAAVFVTEQISGDGESNWLEGVQLLALYLVVAILFFFLPA